MNLAFRHRLLASTIAAGTLVLSVAAHAQDASAADPANPAPDANQAAPAAPATPATTGTQNTGNPNEIVVTGTLLRNPNLTSTSPVLVTNREEINLRQSNTAEELVREIPGVVPAIGSGVNNGSGGFATLNLRGLGDNRNVVLLDGTRIVPTTLTGVVDLNDIPLALIDRVDVLTGGATTTYGADAISGVVNFVTRRNFSGIEADASEQINQTGDGNVRRFDLTTGANFDGGRGNVVLGIGYQRADAVYQGDRGFSSNSIASQTGEAGGSGTTPYTGFNFGSGYKEVDPADGILKSAFAAYNFNPYNLLETPFKRYNIFGEGHYEVSDGIEVYSRGLYSNNTVDTIVAPSGSFGSSFTFSLNNPYLSDGLRTQLCAAAGVAATACTPDSTLTAVLRRRTPEVGNRVSSFETNVFDYQAGIRGDIGQGFQFNAYGAYGKATDTQTFEGYTDLHRLQQGLLLNADGTCTDSSNGCVPIDIFGPPGSITSEQASFLQVTSTTRTRTSLAQFHADVSGSLFSLPTASNPVSVAVGTEYRKYHAAQDADDIAENPGELGGAGSAIIPFSGAYHVVEGFGEVNAPLIQDKPFFHNLTVDAGVRYSHYSINNTDNRFSATTYKGGALWEPASGFRFRADYSHAVRAPNINELFEPRAVGLTNLLVDPCSGAKPVNNPNLRAICIAQGAPASSIGNITNPSAGQPNVLFGGNSNLKPEKANTYSFGTVLEPKSLLPGFTASVDYYHIDIKDAISYPAPDDSIGSCFNNVTAASATSAACLLIHRDPTTGGLDGDPAGSGTGLPGIFSNSGRLKTNGIDLSAAYRRNVGVAHVGLSFTGNYTFHNMFRSQPGGIFRDCVGYYSSNCGNGGGESIGSLLPKFQWSQRTTVGIDKVDVSLLWRHIDKMRYEPRAYQAQLSAAADDPDDCGTDFATTDSGGCVINPEFARIKAANYLDLSVQATPVDHFQLVLAVENLLDRKPPIVGSDVGSTTYNSGNTYPSTYDTLGRRFIATARIIF